MVTAVRYVRRLCQGLFLRDSAASQGVRLFKGAAGIFLLRISYTGLTFLTGILIAQTLGVVGFGTYNYVLTWVFILGIVANMGFDNLLVREIATYSTQAAWDFVRGILRYANQVVFFLSSALALGAIAVAWKIGIAENVQLFSAFCVAMISLPIVAMRNLMRGAIKGFNHVALGLLPELLLAPLILIVLVGSSRLFLPGQISATWVTGLYSASALITLGIASILLHRVLPLEVQKAQHQYQIRHWLQSALPFIFLEGLYAVNAHIDVLMLGGMRGVEAAGIYVPVTRGAGLIVFAAVASVTSALAPMQASLYAEGKRQELQQLMTKSAVGVLLVSVMIALPLVVLGHWYLLLFGEEFTQGHTALTILCFGQVAGSVMALAGSLLNMTGFERYTLISASVGIGANVVLNAVLIPIWSVEGAAIATCVGVVLSNVMNVIWANQKLGIYTRLW